MLTYYAHPFLIAAAVIPAAVLLIYVYKADRLEHEPMKLLLPLILYGVIPTGSALVAERIGGAILPENKAKNSLKYTAWMCFVVVALSEEGFKYLLLKKKTWRSPQFNCQFDGVVYAVFVSLGFALWENIGYVLMYGFSTAMVRALTAVPGHACFGVFMGAWYGVARKYENAGQSANAKFCRFMAVLIPVLMHGFYDFTATMESGDYWWLFCGFVMVMFFTAFLLIRKLSASDRYIA
ncbi:MAG: PrsW family glutamic-type intramembrane protease [Clostridia bacterium]|nr:PrsW family glutamic-type intramembrane protease [Clostridia bacterium]